MPGTAVLCFQMILKIRVAEAPVVMLAAHRFHGIEAAVFAALIAAVLAGVTVVEAQAAVLAEVIRIVRIHCTHPLGAVGVALAALLAQLAGFAELVLVLLIRDPAVAARADVLVPLGARRPGSRRHRSCPCSTPCTGCSPRRTPGSAGIPRTARRPCGNRRSG